MVVVSVTDDVSTGEVSLLVALVAELVPLSDDDATALEQDEP